MSETITTASPADRPVTPADTFCSYLAKQFVAKKGFAVGTVPEAESLGAVSDIVLTSHGTPFTILCLIDREAHPGKEFDLPMPDLKNIVEECQRYSDQTRVGSSERKPVIIRVIEVGSTSTAQLERLKTITLPAPGTLCLVSALAVDPAAGSVWSSSLQGQPEWGFVEEVLRQLREPETMPAVAVELPPRAVPYLSIIFVATLVTIFAMELLFGIDPPTKLLEPSIRTLLMLGGLQYLLTLGEGQWWRIFTGPLLHANLLHLGLNSLTLVLAGEVLERMVGRIWFGAFFVMGALGGACGSLLFNPHSLVSVGASGAIMGMFAAILVLSFRYTAPETRSALRGRALQVLVPSLLPFLSIGQSGKIDYGAHAGGAVAGAFVAWILLNVQLETDALPRLRKIAAVIVALGLLGTVVSAAETVSSYRSLQAAMLLMPPQALPKSDSDIHESAATWYVSKYPDDPRSHFYKAIFLMKKPDFPAAEQELRIALAQKEVMDRFLPPSFKLTVLGVLALALSGEQRLDEARETAMSVCQDESSSMSARLRTAGLCAKTN
jgi:rhomboid protease GluP